MKMAEEKIRKVGKNYMGFNSAFLIDALHGRFCQWTKHKIVCTDAEITLITYHLSDIAIHLDTASLRFTKYLHRYRHLKRSNE